MNLLQDFSIEIGQEDILVLLPEHDSQKESSSEKDDFFPPLLQNQSLPFKVMHLSLFLNMLFDSLSITVLGEKRY